MLVRVLCLTILVRGLLGMWSLSDVSRWLKKTARRFSSRTQDNEAYRKRAAWAANAVGHRLLPKRPCLTQALVLQYILLRGEDELAQLHVGAAKEDEELRAHAWVERTNKVPIGGRVSPQIRAARGPRREDRPSGTRRSVLRPNAFGWVFPFLGDPADSRLARVYGIVLASRHVGI